MSKKKSKFPDLQELMDFGGKFLKDIKKSLCEIVGDYKKAHDHEDKPSPKETSHRPRPTSKKTTSKKTIKKSDE